MSNEIVIMIDRQKRKDMEWNAHWVYIIVIVCNICNSSGVAHWLPQLRMKAYRRQFKAQNETM